MLFDKTPTSITQLKTFIDNEKSYGHKVKYHRTMPVTDKIHHWIKVLNKDDELLFPHVLIPQSQEELNSIKELCDYNEDDAPHINDDFSNVEVTLPEEETIDPTSYEMKTLDGSDIPPNNSIVPPKTRGFNMPDNTKEIAIQTRIEKEEKENETPRY